MQIKAKKELVVGWATRLPMLSLDLLLIFVVGFLPDVAASALQRVKYNSPGLVVDLGVGLWAWPLPMDYDGDGDYDIVVCCPDKPGQALQRDLFLRERRWRREDAGFQARRESWCRPQKYPTELC